MAVELCMTYGEGASPNPPKEKEEEEKAHEMAVAAATDKAINHSVTAPFATALHRRLLLYYIHYTHIKTTPLIPVARLPRWRGRVEDLFSTFLHRWHYSRVRKHTCFYTLVSPSSWSGHQCYRR